MEIIPSNTFLKSSIFVTLLLCSSTSLADTALSLSGPSQAIAGDTVVLNGTLFSPGASYTLETVVNNKRSNEVVTAGNDGSLQYQLITSYVGAHHLSVLDSQNNVVATLVVNVHKAGE
ncbi:hypothetical protein LMJ53_03880 [Rheinheimera sp. UJ51]|uniref:hypothetical protein n=1 Tax=unclassified Rheinheimera TaxID=115860 RepID=UPI001E2E3CE4|nr:MULTISPECIES: hypothetical protein [unclassified Rheinheimera]MCC5450875.1 hypothetical protein [Rheinheimera sp. UJ51]MCF4008452.1 hypothetical protein [Rheinheimera sp. UJ63]